MVCASAVFSADRENAAVAWGVVGVLVASGAWLLARGDLLWVTFAAVTLALAAVPAAVTRDPGTLVPAELLGVAAMPVVAAVLGAPQVIAESMAYLGVAALALLFTAELAALTPVKMPLRVAIPFVVLAALAVAGAWTVVQWLSDAYLGTGFVPDVNAAMWDLVVATVAAMVAGPAFALYFETGEVGR